MSADMGANTSDIRPRKVALLIRNAHVITVDADLKEYADGYVAVDDGQIVGVGASKELEGKFEAEQVHDAGGKMCLPGLINAHMHPAFYLVTPKFASLDQSEPGLLSRGGKMGQFLALFGRVDHIGITEDETYLGALAGLVRMLRTGSTCVNDGGFGKLTGIANAIQDSGLRGIATYGGGGDLAHGADGSPPTRMGDVDVLLGDILEEFDRWHGSYGGRIRCWFNVPTDLNGSDEYWTEVKRLAEARQVGISSHVATVATHDEMSMAMFGKRGIPRLADLGVLGPNWQGIHMGFVNDQEIEILKESDASIAHCPATSMGSGKGIFGVGSIPKMVDRGVTVALGSDSPQWGDMIQQMQLAYYGHKDAAQDDLIFSPYEVLDMATRSAAKSLLWDDEIGTIEVGKKADLTLISFDNLRYASLPHPLLGLMRAGHGGDVDTVIVEGKILMADKTLCVVDEEKVMADAAQATQSLLSRF
ncbi:amidohydrolase family protein [Parasphingopyxis sp.]|uniref:amidohydrolase family protein n=1 Tax=Parasphingopyxis sp. TaxID=1920299 RepID=UPI002610A85E|nr:amidohydrolase family protein [Parasphingopyxis sp.]